MKRSTKLYGTEYFGDKVIVYDNSHPHSVLQIVNTGEDGPTSLVFDASGNFYVAHNTGGSSPVHKYNSAGTFLAGYAPAVEWLTGPAWIALASNQTTLYYTSGGSRVMRFDTVAGQLPDFASGLGVHCYGLRLLPPFDGSAGLLVGCESEIKRLNGAGAVVQTYAVAGLWELLDLDPNGTSFWAADTSFSGGLYRFNIATGAVEVGPIPIQVGGIWGLCVKGGTTAPPPQPKEYIYLRGKILAIER
jgi:hypothetical protein